jgi:hypothetical protein
MLTLIQKIYSSHEAREQAGVFSSHLLLNASFFVVVLFASKQLDASAFADLSLANSWIMVLATLFSFGLDQSALKLSIERKDSGYIAVNLVAKAILFIVAFSVFFVWTALYGRDTNMVVVAAAAGVALWSSTRVVEQYERRFTKLAWLNVSFAVARVCLGVMAVATHDWVLIVLALHVVAQLPVHLMTLTRAMRELHPKRMLRSLRPMLAVSPLMFASISLYSALALITMNMLHGRGDALATASFGVALIFIAPLDLFINTIRIYVLPQVLSLDHKEIDVFGLGAGSFNVMVIVFAAVFFGAMLPTAAVIQWIYGTQFPMAAAFFLIYFGAVVATSSIGFYNIRVQRQNLLRLAVIANVFRVAATGSMVLFPSVHPVSIVVWSGVVLIAGEIALWFAINWAERVNSSLPAQ